MVEINVERLVAAGVPPTPARLFVDPLRAAMVRFGITSPARAGAFIGQCRVETDEFGRLEENLYFSDPTCIMRLFPTRIRTIAQAQALARNPKMLANVAYADTWGNGEVDSGDGWRFHGRGVFQFRGRSCYADAAVALERPYVTLPGLLALPEDAVLSAAWLWHAGKCNLLADAWNIDAISRVLGSPAQLDRRRQYSQDAVRAFT